MSRRFHTHSILRIHITGCGCGCSADVRCSGRGSRSGLSDYEFKAQSHDGFGEDWPISHADLAPYYARVEEIFQVAGAAGWTCRSMPDGNFVLDDAPWSQSMQRFIAAASPKRRCRSASSGVRMGRDGLASSVNLLLPDADETGKLTSIRQRGGAHS